MIASAVILTTLAGLQVYWYLDRPMLALLAVLPAALGLALLRPRRHDRRVLAALLSLFYFVQGITIWATGAGGGLAMLEVGLCTGLYVLLILGRPRRPTR